MRTPDFVLVGAQKAASTFLHDGLARHPDVWMAPGELPFLESPDYEAGGPEALLRCFAGRTESRLGFRRPNLLGDPKAAERLARHLPDARLVAVLRDPVDRAVSAYHHYVVDGFLPVLPVDRGLRHLLDDPRSLGPRAHEVLDFGLYARHLDRFDAWARAGRLLVLLHEDLAAEPEATLARTFRFLGVDEGFVPTLRGRPQAVAYAPARIRFRRLPNHVAFRYDPDGRRRRPRGGLGPAFVRAVAGVDRLLLAPIFGNARPRLDAELRARLAAFYADDVDRLSRRLGRPLDGWLERREGR